MMMGVPGKNLKNFKINSMDDCCNKGLNPALAFFILLFALSSCRNPADSKSIGSQNDAAEASVEFSQDSLDVLEADLLANKYTNTHALLIWHDGKRVYENYFTGTDSRWGDDLGKRPMGPDSLHDLRSVSKSITSLLLGIALADSLQEKVERSMISYFPGYNLEEEKSAITLHHMLTMTPGLAWNEMDVPYTDETNDEIRTYDARDPAKYVLERPLVHTPGSIWYYNGGTTQVLSSMIYNLTGKPVDKYAEEKLFEPLGITRYEWIGPGTWIHDQPAAMSGLRMTARDLEKVGILFIHKGMFEGSRIIPEKWVDLSSERFVKETARWSEDGRWGYGYQWWIGTLPNGPKVIAGVGNGNQRLFIVPDAKLVVTIFAGEYNIGGGHSNRLMYRIFGMME